MACPMSRCSRQAPPGWMAKGIQRLDERSRQGRARVVAALATLGWTVGSTGHVPVLARSDLSAAALPGPAAPQSNDDDAAGVVLRSCPASSAKPGVRSTGLLSANQTIPPDVTAGSGGDASRSSAALAEAMCIHDGLVSEQKESFDRRRQKFATATPAVASSVADQGALTRNRRGREPQEELAGRATHEPGAVLMDPCVSLRTKRLRSDGPDAPVAHAATDTHVGISSHSQGPADKKRPAVSEMELIDGSRNLRSRVIEPSSSSSSVEVSSPLVEPSWAHRVFFVASRASRA